MNILNRLTPSLENYIETIFILENSKGQVRVTDIATEIKVSKASVHKAVKILKASNYVYHEHYGEINLTPEGRNYAISIANRHIVLKKFFTEVLGIDASLAETESCLIEHIISLETIDKLEDHTFKFLKDTKKE